MNQPPIVSRAEWQRERDALLQEEKELTRAHDALNARRRQLPMTEIVRVYVFKSDERSNLRLVDLFSGRDQLIVYHNMLTADHICPGCSIVCDHMMNNFAHLHARRTSFMMVARASVARIEARRRGWAGLFRGCRAKARPFMRTS